MLKILKSVFGLLSIVLAVYALITGRFVIMPYMIFLLGAMFVVIGITEFQLKRKGAAFSNFIVSLFLICASIKGFILN
ncbi:DUF3953 domain-containing protein [Gottfriedia acidiceleris]|uniref:DUF3953 domain-containing protein n=1 Tax=Gottfriedia acidiceleris TaxID=371036 RepID=UPI000B43CF5C|nr:DUF3953 domain-containing protein [Gottfriedia acidiceleris]